MAPVPAMAQGMAVPGEASVSETGAARYSIPIATPPGTAGMVPSLSLSYDSHSGNGLLGMGWQLEGLAAIGRCPRTMAQDGVRGSINYDANDRFCLDGQRLIPISGAYGADGTEYRTEIESFTKVISRGVAGTGPAWFEVRTKSGQVMEFGNSADSRILAQGKPSARSWAVNKVADTKGNFYAVTYVNDAANGEAYPSRIDYTGNAGAGLVPYNSVRFVYDAARPDATTAYHAGSMVRSSVRMSKVQTYAGAALVSDYRLSFAQGTSTGRSQLTSVTLCDGGGSCLPATSFTWQQGGTTPTVISNVGGQDGQLVNYRAYIADFNGDGLVDVFWDSSANSTSPWSSGDHTLWVNSGNDTFQVVSDFLGQNGATISSDGGDECDGLASESSFRPFISDFNRDGRSDIWWYNPKCGLFPTVTLSPTIQWFSNSAGDYSIIPGPPKENWQDSDGKYHAFVASITDINGDGRTDFVWNTTATVGNQYIWRSNQDGTMISNSFASPFEFSIRLILKYGLEKPISTDFNADGFVDMLWMGLDGTGFRLLWLGNGDGTFHEGAGEDTSVNQYSPTFADFNGDGQTDILWDNIDAAGRSQGTRILWLSKGDGTFEKINNPGSTDGTAQQFYPEVVDVNGDGRHDVLWNRVDGGLATGSRILWLSTGSGFSAVPFGQDGTLANYLPVLADFNGDGKTDILWDRKDQGDSRSKGQRVLWTSDGVSPDLLRDVTTGLGVTATVTYKSLVDSAVYSKDSNAADPLIDVQGPIQVVSRREQSDGIGGIRAASYNYAGAKAHLDGRGFLGFREVKATDLATGIAQTTAYRQDYPLTGLVAQEIKTKGGVALGSSVNTHNAADLGGTRRQVTLTQSVTTGADLDGTPLPSATTGYQYDGFGNAAQITVTNADGFSKVTTNSYANDTAAWLLGRLTAATVTSQAPDATAQLPGTDSTPSPFGFTDVTNAQLGTMHEASATVSGFNVTLTAQVTGAGAQIRKNGGGTWGNTVAMLPGDTVNVRMTSSASYSTAMVASVTVGSAGAAWRITTIAPDDTPNAFDFPDVIEAALNTPHEASAIVSGFSGPLTATSIGGGAQLRKNGSGNWATSVSVNPGETLNIRMTSSSANSTSVMATVTLGTATVDWRITTLSACAGLRVGGYCWYYGSKGQSCDAVCAGHAGCNLSASRDYAGSGGTLQNCQNVFSAFGVTGAVNDSSGSAATGCGYFDILILPVYVRIFGQATTCNASHSSFKRICSCNN